MRRPVLTIFQACAVATLCVGALSAQETNVRVLIPTVANNPIPGAFGSKWITEISGRNLGPQKLAFFSPLCPPFECVFAEVPSGATFTSLFPTSVNGAVVGLWPDQAPQMILSVRVRDLSRASETWGTEIPVVSEIGLNNSPMTLLDLPTGEDFRVTVRMYSFSFEPDTFKLRIFPLAGDSPAAELSMPTDELRDAAGASQGIGVAVLPAVPSLSPQPDRVRIEIQNTTTTKFWAFATVTDNATQHVTVVSGLRASVPPN